MENRFFDEVVIEVYSGAGGGGAVHFRRERYKPRGGPDGGDGGDGGDVLFVVRENLKTLSHLKQYCMFRAENGRPGGGQRKSGRSGRDMVIPVPPGTLIKDPQSQEVLRDLSANRESWLFLKGGRGGRGNWHFATPTRQSPRFAEPGRKGLARTVLVELALIADVGLVGKPNAGKSTLLSVLTNSHPRIAAYPFTTRIPHIGVCSDCDQPIILADIPGIIEGASRGAGLGLRFLRHIRRTRLLAFLVDLSEPNPLATCCLLEEELGSYDRLLLSKPRLLIGTKLDLPGAESRLAELRIGNSRLRVLGISALSGTGIEELKKALAELIGDGR